MISDLFRAVSSAMHLQKCRYIFTPEHFALKNATYTEGLGAVKMWST